MRHSLTAFTFLILVSLSACQRSEPMGLENDLQQSLQDVIDEHPEATIAVAIIDPFTDTRFDVNGDTSFHAASMMKVPIMIEVFRQVEAGRFALSDSLPVENQFRSIVDSSEFSIETDSDDGIYERLGQSMSVYDLTHSMITISSNLAANILIDHVSAEAVQSTVEALGGDGVRVLRGVEDLKAYEAGLNNSATAKGLAALFEAIMLGEAVSAAADSQMIDILLEQQFNSVIPPGLPVGSAMAHKTGWLTSVHHDGGIVFPPEGEPYVLVLMTKGLSDENESARVGSEIATLVHNLLRPPQPEAATEPTPS